MAHRGRLNVLAHVLQKPYAQILAEFKDPVHGAHGYRIDLGWTGDVKYHAGARRSAQEPDACRWRRTRATSKRSTRWSTAWRAPPARTVDGPGAVRFDPRRTLPILIHGDAAFPGQGIVAETLNLSRLDGYDTGGTIHIIANNQLGFTADLEGVVRHELRERPGARLQDPDHPRQRRRSGRVHRSGAAGLGLSRAFRRDFLIDLVGYRRYGHNEGDEPAFTQPQIYAEDRRASDRAQDLCADAAGRRAARSPPTPPTTMLAPPLQGARGGARLAEAGRGLRRAGARAAAAGRGAPGARPRCRSSALRGAQRGAARAARRLHAASQARARAASAARRCSTRPTSAPSTGPPPRSSRSRRSSPTASPIRFTGEDVERGTFSHRHAVFHDVGHRQAAHPAAGAAAGQGGVRDPQQPALRERRRSASSSATTCRSRAAWCCGKRSTATSSTARRSSSTSS